MSITKLIKFQSALDHKMCGLGIEMCALGPILACTYSSGPYGGKGAYVYNQ